ncbi:TPA: hypothetical protein N3A29_000176 [Salmonella enterica subsp. diarizonae serovar 16:z10:e,n,x,z15]|nr:hypothetical protein [Salmonella enterica subsp. diarizonae serovar 16:z10:e,n,x,z15]
MNREEFNRKNLVELIDKMSEEDKNKFYEASVNGDDNKRNALAKNMGMHIYLILVICLIRVFLMI